MMMTLRITLCLGLCSFSALAFGQTPLHQRIDQAIQSGYKGPVAKQADDAEFLRRVTLDFTGIIPTSAEARAFFADKAADKRAKLIDRLLNGPDYPRRMQEFMHVMLEERRENKESPLADWESFLFKSFADNKPWDQFVREILGAEAGVGPINKFYIDRGGDAHLITKDVGRLFLGRDMECARCHDHPTVETYKQAEYFGLYAFLHRSFVGKSAGKTVLGEKFLSGKLDFESVFTMQKGMTGPRLPGQKELVEPTFAKGEEYVEKPDQKKGVIGKPKFSPRGLLADELSKSNNAGFVRNSANRLWFMLMGRGVVHPLDMHHEHNPPSNPKLLDVLSEGLVELKFDTKAFLREIALSQAYQRSSRMPRTKEEIAPGSFVVAELRPLSPEQLLHSIGQASGALAEMFAVAEAKLPKDDAKKRTDAAWRMQVIRTGFKDQAKGMVVAFGSPAGEPEVEFQPSLAGALYISNEKTILAWLLPKEDNLAGRLAKQIDTDKLAEELYLSVLTRLPTKDETAEVSAHLKKRGDQRTLAIQELAWALLSSTEFRLNH